MQELVAQGRELLAETTTQLAQGKAVCSGRGRGDEVSYGFGLAKIHFAIEEGTLGVFSRCCQTTSAIDEQAQGLLEDVG